MTNRARTRFLIAVAAIGSAAAFLRLFPPDNSTWYPACPFHALTGLLCPICGGTRALAALVAGRSLEAIHSNPLIAIGAPLFAIRVLWAYATPDIAVIPARALPYVVALAFAFTIVRNLLPA